MVVITCPHCSKPFTPEAPAAVGLTERQNKLFKFIKVYIRENSGVAPNFDEMKSFLGVSSKTTVHHLLSELEVRGVIRRLPNKTRAISIVGEATC
ncbi:LexA family protein [Rhizobium puerariae]|uniref:LexA family protein n=1 Tax=Rhizobium puerariae TaxID=1585791 RepID=A0ABV6AN71_9HYPH